ncbi:response regulator transcription factor [Pseudonocardia sp. WMMC193]|uniref:response regulator transcription factor n=1 Tax=Pseudonocardia sp. WMMC193 TaxID=2911965 RepID=UPI001F3DA6EB|nr:response regulator transcription factor [Pseudonocardia sp. WMMC193]MCF7550721.1 response regulator transcription factor [Pseudonocardia sp. WMMC193]
MPPGPRAVLVDDHEIVLEGLERALVREGIPVLASFRDAESAQEFLRGSEVELCVVDLRLGAESGTDLVRAIRSLRPQTRVAVLTSFEDRAAVAAAVDAGATGYFLKDASSGELCEGLRRVAGGQLVIDARLVSAVLGDRPRPLTESDVAILRLVAEGLSNREIGARLHLSPHTVKEYLSRTMRKLGTRTRAETAARAAQEGLLPPVL